MAKWTVIKAKVPDYSKFEAALKPALLASMIPAQKDFQDFVSTWKHRPEIILDYTKKANDIQIFTGVISNYSKGQKATPEDLMMFVGRGTEKGYIIPSKDWKAKTTKGVIKSGNGSGKVFRTLKEMPGIEDREIEKTVLNKEKRLIIEAQRKAIMNAAIKSGLTRI